MQIKNFNTNYRSTILLVCLEMISRADVNVHFIFLIALQSVSSQIFRCHNEAEVCSPNPCAGGFDCKVTGGNIHCDPLPVVSFMETLQDSKTLNVSSVKLICCHPLSDVSNNWIFGCLGDLCWCAWISLLGRHLCLRQDVLCSAEEENTRLCPGFKWVSMNFPIFLYL